MSIAPYDPPVINSFFQADPAAHVWSCDPSKVYIYGSHDWNSTVLDDDVGGKYDMKDYWVLTQRDTKQQARVAAQILDLPDIKWAKKQLWAPDATEKDGKYYLFFPAKDPSETFRIGVAVSDKPDGKFVAEANYIAGSYSIDPTVLADDDKSYHMYFGGIWGGQLQAWDNNVYNASCIGGADNACPRTGKPARGPRYAKLSHDLKKFEGPVKEVVINDKDGKPMQDSSPRRFFEGPSINKVDGTYYLHYSTGDYHTVEVATSKKREGPFTWKSTLLQPVQGWTTHESIVKFKGKWYVYYADSSQSGQDNLRTTKVREVLFKDGTFQLAQPQPVATQWVTTATPAATPAP